MQFQEVETRPDASMGRRQRSQVRLPLTKKAIYGFLVTIAFFGVVEGVLALLNVDTMLVQSDPYVGFESTIRLFVEHTDDDGEVVLCTAKNKLDFFNAQQFPKKKPRNSIRVFCLGGSTTFGRPYDDATSFPGWLRELLPAADTTQRWEVINAGGISYASYRVAALMEELCNYEPDVFVLYTGHNEFLEERTYRQIREMPAAVRRLSTVLGRTRSFSLLHALMGHENDEVGRFVLPAEVDAVLDHTVGPSSYHRDDQLRHRVLEHFEFNLTRMADMARSSGAIILFVKPAANLKDFSPFKSQHDSTLGDDQRLHWAALFAQGKLFQADSDFAGAVGCFQKAAEIDGRFADLHYRTGGALFAEGRFSEARVALLRAIDEDVCPLRAMPEIQSIVQRTAMAKHVPVVDFEAILTNDCLQRYGHGVPGSEYFLDHVHLNTAANRLLARAIVEAMIQKGIVKAGSSWEDDAVLHATRRMESRLDPQLQSRALRNLAQVLGWAGKQHEAGPLALQAVQLRSERGLPEDPECLFYAAVHLAMTGSNKQAITYLQKVIGHEPDNAEAQWRLAQLLLDEARNDEAHRHFVKATQLDPSDADSHHRIGTILMKYGQYEDALRWLYQANQLHPDNAGIRFDIARALQQLGHDQGAIDWYRSMIRLNRDGLRAHQNLAELLMRQDQVTQAIEHYEEVLRLDPNADDARRRVETARRQLRDG